MATMNSILSKFTKDLEKKIITINNIVIKAERVSSLQNLTQLLNEENIWNLTEKDYNRINKYLPKEQELTDEEKDYLLFYINMPSNFKEIKKGIGISDAEQKCFENIKQKLMVTNNNENDVTQVKAVLTQYKDLLNKLNNNDINIITEFDIIKDIAIQNEYTTEEYLELFEAINKKNYNILQNHNISISEEEEVLSLEKLTETNLNPELLEELFKKFRITWSENEKLKNQKDNAKKDLEKYKELLLKYGNYDKMLDILNYLVEKELTFVFKNHGVLTKTLLFSSVESIKKLIEETEKREIDYKKMIENRPNVLFPPSRDFTIRIKRRTSKKQKEENKISGQLTHCLKNLEQFEELGYSPKEIFKECPGIFASNPKTIKATNEKLKQYGLSLKYPDGTQRKGFSLLASATILDKIDAAIECGCYEYLEDNLSKLAPPADPFYRVKLGRSLGYTDQDIYRAYQKRNRTSYALKKAFGDKKETKFGATLEETFKMYNAEEYKYENKELCDNILENNENNIITELVEKDYLIQKIDESYKVDELRYNFNGVIISRLKVLRYYQTLLSNNIVETNEDLLMYLITRGSMLNKEELTQIEKCIKPKKNVKRKDPK